jgi:hypothetical protein
MLPDRLDRFLGSGDFVMNNRIAGAAMALVLSGLAANASASGLTVIQTSDIAGGIAAFGTSTLLLDWDLGGAPGTASGNINLQNWLNGAGFAGADLAVNGAENVTWTFAGPVSRIGFAISTGLESVFTNQVNNLGAVFQLSTNTGDTGALTLVDGGSGYAAWVEISSATPFTSLTFFEPSGDIADQYWGDVFSAAVVPEPATWAMMIIGFGAAGSMIRRRKAVVA